MNALAARLPRLHWLNFSGALLIALLQRTPVVRMLATASDVILRSPAATLLKSAASAAAALGAVHSLAGATTLSASTPSPAAATVGTAKTIAYGMVGTESQPKSWTVGGSVPPGMTFTGGATSGVVNTPSGVLTLSGTPTTAGNYTVTIKAWENANGSGNSSATFNYTVAVSGGSSTAPAFSTQPASQTVTAGANVSFTVAATGSPAPTLQWQKNGGAIAGQTTATLSLSNVQAADAASYTCVATNSAGTATSNAATLTVNPAATAPAFTTQPSSQSVTAGASVSFTVVATGSPTPTLQWQKNGGAIAGQTTATLSLSNVQAADAASYTCVATNSAGTATSNAATLTVNPAATAPAFTTQPSSQSVTAGASVSFTVVATGSPAPALQWQKNGSAMAGQTAATLSLANVQAADAASYTCVATNSAGTATSNAAALTVNPAAIAPAFTTNPGPQTAVVGASVTFTVVATGSPTPTLQWQKNGGVIAGQTNASLSLANVQAADAASYTCVATNSAGTATSSAAALTINAPPAFTTQPASQTALAGANVTFTIVATGTPAPALQWQKNGAALPGQTGTSLTLSSVAAADAANYACVATNTAGSVTSSTATLTITAAPVAPAFTTQPVSQTVNAGASATFTVVVTGTPTPTLQWQKNGAPIAGETGTALTLGSVSAADAASYACVATNASGTATSSAATLTLGAVSPAFTTQPVSQTVNAGTTVTLTVVATGSPAPALQWRKNGAAIAGQTTAALLLANVQAADAAAYTCVATNASGTATSATATLTVNPLAVAPAFATQPASQSVNAGSNVTFTVVVSGSPVPALQWRKNGVDLAGQTAATLSLTNVQAASAGAYACVATNTSGSATSATANLSINAVPVPDAPPVFTTQPVAQTVTAGTGVTFTVVVTGSPTPTLQWRKDGVVLPGQNSASLALTGVQAADAGAYACVAANSAGTATSAAASLTVNPAASGPGSRISNVSVRTTLAAAQTLIVGFTMQGGGKPVLIRAVGPGLANFGVPGTMEDPKVLLYKDATLLTQNDNWGGAAQLTTAFASLGAFPLTPASLDAALMRNCEGGNTAQVSGPAGGNVLVEAYDAGTGTSPRLTNVSARNQVGTGSDILIAGVTLAGTGSKNLLIRAVGPTLGAFGVPGTLVDPKLAVYNSSGVVIAENDDWSAGLAGTFASVGAFALAPGSKDAALTITLPPGGYTIQVSGADGGTGEALIELYELP